MLRKVETILLLVINTREKKCIMSFDCAKRVEDPCFNRVQGVRGRKCRQYILKHWFKTHYLPRVFPTHSERQEWVLEETTLRGVREKINLRF